MIRFTFTYLRPVALFLLVMVLFQSCVVYDHIPVTIEQAISIDHEMVKQIKIKMTNGDKIIADSIYYKGNDLYYTKRIESREQVKNSEFYKSKSYIVEVKIDKDKITQIFLQNRRKSRTATVLITTIPSAIVVFLVILYIGDWVGGIGFQ